MSEISKQALKVDNNTSFPDNNTGYISPSILRAFNVNVIDSTVNQTTYSADSASWNADIAALEAFTASQQPSFTQLNAFTASASSSIKNLNEFTQSASNSISLLGIQTASFYAYTASINQIQSNGVTLGTSTRFNLVGSGTFFSASLVQNVNGPIATLTFTSDNGKVDTSSFNAFSASINQFTASTAVSITNLNLFTSSVVNINQYTASTNIRLSNIESTTASLNASVAALNAYTQSDDVSIDLLNLFTSSANVSIAALNTYSASNNQRVNSLEAKTGSYATTGSNQFIGNQVITGSVTISSSAAIDLVITGAANVVSNNGLQINTIQPNTSNINTTKDASVNAENYTFGSTASVSSIYVGVFDDPNFNTDVELKLSADSNGLSFNDWDNGSTFSYVPFITIEPNLGNNPSPVFTRGLVVTGSSAVQNLNVSGSVVISGSTSLRGNLTQSTGSITAFGNVRTTNGVFTSSINGGLEIDGLGYVGSGSAGAFFIGTTTQDLKIQNWYSSSVDGKNIVIENFSPTGSNPIFGKVALRARGVGGAVTVENTSVFRVECNTQITGSLRLSGSVYQNVVSQSIVSSTASIDLSVANFYTVALPSATTTNLNITNPGIGQTAMIRITSNTQASASFSANVKQPSGFAYVPSSGSGDIDVLTLACFDGTNVLVTNVTKLV